MRGRDLRGVLAGVGLAYVAVFMGLVLGWIINIFTIINHVNDPLTAMFVLRVLGIIVMPLGGILGYV